ncbi:unnamed protein product, partial [Nezara viridula]
RELTTMEAVRRAGYNIDISSIDTSDLTDDERITLQKELEELFQPRDDPSDLPKDLQMAAEKQVNERPGVLKENIRALRELLKQEENLNARTDDLFLAAFLRGRKNDVEKAFRCVKNFYEFGYRYPDMYSIIYPSENPEVFDQHHFGSLPGTDRKGRKICAIIPSRLRPSEIPVIQSFMMGRTVLELMLMDLRLQVMGTCVIFDMGGLSLVQQARLITPTVCWHLAMCVQDKIPMRLKAVHVVNQPSYFTAIHSIFKRLLKKKLRKRIFLHGTNYKALHEHIAPEELPEEWGGTRKPLSGTLTKTLLLLNEDRFREWTDKGYKDNTI